MTVMSTPEVTAIVGVNTGGNFVHETQTMGEEHRHVSQLWLDKCKPVASTIDGFHADAKSRIDVRLSFADISSDLDAYGNLCLRLGNNRFKPTPHSLGQFFTRLGIPATVGKYLGNQQCEESALLCEVIDLAIMRADKSDVYVARCDKNGNLRAFMTDSFTAIPNDWLMETLHKLLPGSMVSHWYGDFDNIRGNILIPDTLRREFDSDYGSMLSVTNSEIGDGRFEILPSLFRAICMNGCIWSKTDGIELSRVHRGNIDLNVLGKQIAKDIVKQLDLVPHILNALFATRQVKWTAKPEQMFGLLHHKLGITPNTARNAMVQWAKHEGKEKTAFGIINGLTRESQNMAADDWKAIDQWAGTMVGFSPEKWANYDKAANAMSESEVVKALNLAS